MGQLSPAEVVTALPTGQPIDLPGTGVGYRLLDPGTPDERLALRLPGLEAVIDASAYPYLEAVAHAMLARAKAK